MNPRSNLITAFIGLFIMLIIGGCSKYPNDADRLLDSLVVTTQVDTEIEFSQFQTFMISDSIGVISDTDTTRKKNENTELVISQVIKNMEALGYSRVEEDGDLALSLAYFSNTNVTVYYPGWFWGYPGYYPPGYWGYPGYGYYYPYYPVYYSSYTVGTLTMEMIDLKNVTEEEKLFIRWNAFIRGLMTGAHTENEILNSIDQAFTQTPALQR